ncbi:MAG: PTS sugar transporter subunit IIB [Solobacterium sp.]|nr:PTS sugar transporter subunit IIB [Solobacterium sp.]
MRLDERLIHGQIAIKWSRHTNVDRIVVANDAASGSSIIQKSLMMAAPSHIKTTIRSVDESIELLNNPKCQPLKILVLVKNPTDMIKMIESVPDIEKLNIGNYGRVEPEHQGHKRKTYGNNLYIDDLELPLFQKIASSPIECVYQTTPEEPAENLKKLLGM